MVAKKMTYLIVGIVVIGIAYLGWKLTSRSAYESAEYSVIEKDGDIELRDYPDLFMATTSMSRPENDDGSFGRLFRYISGGNEEKQKVAMTTPVFMESSNDHEEGQMGFVIPKKVANSNIPEPANENVSVTKRNGGRFAVIRFAGRANEAVRQEHLDELQAWIKKRGFEVEGLAELAGYDPPWTPGPLRRNEILLRIKM